MAGGANDSHPEVANFLKLYAGAGGETVLPRARDCCSGRPTAITATARASDATEGTMPPLRWSRECPSLAGVAAMTGDAARGGGGTRLLPTSCLQAPTSAFRWQNLSTSQLAEGSGKGDLLTQPPETRQEWG